MNFTVELDEAAQGDLAAIKDRKVSQDITKGLLRLEVEPAKRGKSLKGELKGFYSVRLARGRYRAVYSVSVRGGIVTVIVIALRRAGSRLDAYAIAEIRSG